MTRLTMVADLDRCTGCRSCEVACKEEHGLPPGPAFIRLEQAGPEGEFPDLRMYYLPIACQQCLQPSCVAQCPEDAIRRTEDGLIKVSAERCTACGVCVDACPYGAMVLDPSTALAATCDLCAELRAAGHAPACVAACPAKALAVVDADSPPVPGEPAAGGESAHALLPELGNQPAARFILRRQEWRDRG